MIRNIRILGAALGGIVGLGMAASLSAVFDRSGAYYGFFLAAWVVAWIVVGFAILPYLTIVPAQWIVRQTQALSTAEFVTAVVGLLIGLLMGMLLGIPLSNLPAPLGQWLPLAVALGMGLGMVGLTVAKRQDLTTAAEALGLFRRPKPDDDAGPAGDPHIVVDTSVIIDGRIADIAERASSTARWSSRASCWTSSSTSPTAPTRSAATAAGAAWTSSTGCRRNRADPGRDRG